LETQTSHLTPQKLVPDLTALSFCRSQLPGPTCQMGGGCQSLPSPLSRKVPSPPFSFGQTFLPSQLHSPSQKLSQLIFLGGVLNSERRSFATNPHLVRPLAPEPGNILPHETGAFGNQDPNIGFLYTYHVGVPCYHIGQCFREVRGSLNCPTEVLLCFPTKVFQPIFVFCLQYLRRGLVTPLGRCQAGDGKL